MRMRPACHNGLANSAKVVREGSIQTLYAGVDEQPPPARPCDSVALEGTRSGGSSTPSATCFSIGLLLLVVLQLPGRDGRYLPY